MDDYLAAGPAILERLREEMPALAAVREAADLAGVTERTLGSPEAHVIYRGDSIPAGDPRRGGEGERQVVVQSWMVVLAVRNARGAATGEGVRADAGPLISRALVALAGWSPGVGFRPLVRVQAPAPAYSPAFGYFPLQFQTRIVT